MTAAGIVLPKTKKQMQQKKTWASILEMIKERSKQSIILAAGSVLL